MATVQPLNGRYAHPTRPHLLEWGDYLMALLVGALFALLAALRLGLAPLEHAALDPEQNRRFLFGLFEYLASAMGSLPTVALVGIALTLATLQITVLSKPRTYSD
jgi:hypothetical protein